MRPLGGSDDDRHAGVAALDDRRVEGDAAEEGRRQLGGGALAAAALEDVRVSWPQCGQTKVDMFSTMPSTGTFTLRNIASPLRASMSATSCGVVTITAPARGTSASP